MYNQVKGKTLNGIFKDGVIDYMRAKGNAGIYLRLREPGIVFDIVNTFGISFSPHVINHPIF